MKYSDFIFIFVEICCMIFESVIYYIALVQVIFTGFIFLNKKDRTNSSTLLYLILLTCTADLILDTLNFVFPNVLKGKLPINFFIFLYGPLILLYIRVTLFRVKTLSLANFIHFLPFFFFLSVSLVINGEPAVFRYQFFANLEGKQENLYIVYFSLAYASIVFYTLTNILLINRAKRNIENLYSYELAEKLLYWFKYITVLFFVMYMLQTITGLTSIITKIEIANTNNFKVLGIILFCFSIIYYLINSPELFTEDQSPVIDINNSNTINTYAKSNIPIETLEKCAKDLINVMETKKLYLDNNLDLQDVAKSINYPKHYITQALNIVLKKNFYAFVNEYRVNEFKKRVADKKNQNLTIMSIALDSGFNSKSTFNSIFKKFTGITPSEYVDSINKLEN